MTTFNVSLLDTNVLIYAADKNSPFFKRSRSLIERGLSGEIDLCISPQTISEFFAVITDSKRIDNPRTQEEAVTEIKKYLLSKRIRKIFPGPETCEAMVDLLERYPVKRQRNLRSASGGGHAFKPSQADIYFQPGRLFKIH